MSFKHRSVTRLSQSGSIAAKVAFLISAVTVAAAQAGAADPAAISGAAAATPDASDAAIGEIVVTAQKRAENVQNIPKTVEVVSQARLTQAGVTTLQDLSRVSVSIQGTSAAPFSPPAIRGISSFALSIGVQTQTGIVLDDIPQPSFSTLANELTDVERVEVLPGPQSTLSGRNAAGGLINIVTHNPTSEFTGNLSFEQTNDHQTRSGGYVSGPLSDTVGFSVSAFYDQWDGPLRNVAQDGLRLGGFTQRGVRAKLQWRPAPDWTILLTGFYTKGNFLTAALLAPPFVRADPGAGSAFAPGATLAQLYPGEQVGPYNRTVSSPGNGASANENKGGSLKIGYDSPIGTISSITSYSRNNQPRTDLFFGFPLFGTNIYARTNTDVKYTTEELRLASTDSASKFQYVAGLFYSDTNNFEPYSRAILFPVDWNRSADVKSLALYVHASYEFLPETTLTLGGRYQHDKQNYVFDFVDGSATSSRGSSSYDFVTGEASLQHNFTQNIKGYLTYANAQTGKAYDLEDNNGAASAAGLQPIPSEKVQNFEGGFKTQWFDRRLTINASLFRARYRNYQVQSLQTNNADPNSVPAIRLYAIGVVRTQGAELETSFALSRDLRVGIDATYLDAKILSYPGAQCYVGQTSAEGCVNGLQDRHGPLPGTSKFRTVATANYTLELPDLPFDGTLGALYRYQGRVHYDLFGNPDAQQGGFGVLNLTAGVKGHSGKWTAELFVNNATNRRYYGGLAADQFQAPGVIALTGSYARDSFRYWGGRVGFHF